MVRGNPGAESAGRPFSHLFRDLFFYMHFMLTLALFGLPFGALWLTLGSLLLTLGSLLLTFGSLLVPFGSLLVPWAHFWRSWRSIFPLLVPPSVIFHIWFYNMDGILVPKRAHRHLHALLLSPKLHIFRRHFHVKSCFEKVLPIINLFTDILILIFQ